MKITEQELNEVVSQEKKVDAILKEIGISQYQTQRLTLALQDELLKSEELKLKLQENYGVGTLDMSTGELTLEEENK